MAWTKTKSAIVVGVVAILAVGTSTVIVEKEKKAKLAAFPASWVEDPIYWRLNNPPLKTYPPVLVLRPTRFAGHGGGLGNWNRWVLKDDDIEDLIATAYEVRWTRVVFPEDYQRSVAGQPGYDLMLTLDHHPLKALQEEIAKQFGLVAHGETIVTNALVLRVANPGAPGIKPASDDSRKHGGYWTQDKSATLRDQPVRNFLGGFLETMVQQPVFDETGLNGYHYDLHMTWNPEPGETVQDAFKRALREQLGLELIPTNKPVKMLVVERTK